MQLFESLKKNCPLFCHWLKSIIITLIFFGLLQVYIQTKKEEIKKTYFINSVRFGSDLKARFDRELNALIFIFSGLSAYIKVHHGILDPKEIKALLKILYANSPLIRNLGLAQGTILKYVVPLKGNEKAVGLNYKKIPAQWREVKKTILSKKGTLIGPINLVQGGKAIIYREPIFVNKKYWGLLSTVIDMERILQASFRNLKSRGYNFAIRNQVSKKMIYGNRRTFSHRDSITLSASIPNGKWEYVVVPKKRASESVIILILQWGGVFFSFLIFLFSASFFKLRAKNAIAKEKIEKSEARLKTIINTKLAGISILDEKGNIIFANAAQEKIHGYTQEELLKMNYSQVTYPDDIALGKSILSDIFSGKINSYDGEFRLIHKENKKIVWIHILVTRLVKNYDEESDSILVYFQDIGKQKSNEKKLEELNATKNKFFSIIAHDLRSPFTALLNLLQMYIENYDDFSSTEIKEMMQMLHDSSKNTYKLLENLLSWAKSQSGSLRYLPQKTSAFLTVKQISQLLFSTANTKEIILINEVPKVYFVYVDIYMLETVLRNLITNAIKFTPRKGEVVIGYKKIDSNFLEFYVEDKGLGMSESAIEKLFKVDKTVSTMGTEKERGSGLGLILCKEFVEKNGGEIRVESTLGEGSRFSFTVPLAGKEGEIDKKEETFKID